MLRRKTLIPVLVAETEQQRQAIYRFRYQIYIEEMGKPYRHADHVNKFLTDELDQSATILYTADGDKITGTLRINWGNDPSVVAAFRSQLHLELFSEFEPDAFSFTSRLMVGSRQRNSILAAYLVMAAYTEGRKRDSKFNFAHCAPARLALLDHLGFRRYSEDFQDEEVGRQIPLVLLLQDIKHLEMVDSPFLDEALTLKNNSDTREWFEKRFLNEDESVRNQSSGMEILKMGSSKGFRDNKAHFKETVDEAIEHFPDNEVCRKVDTKQFTLTDYHKMLRMIFNQTHEAPLSFALAGVNCPPRFQSARDYLLHHADEEKTHWQWVLNDLNNTGFQESDLKNQPPLTPCLSYISFNYYIAMKMPVARLAIAAVLEGIGAKYGAKYAREICRLLKLEPNQAQFYSGHGDTDREHIQDIWNVINGCDFTDEEWNWMRQAAQTAGKLYKAMYDEALNY